MSDFDFEEPKERDIRFYLNIWNSSKPNKPNTVAVPYRGGYRAGDGLNDVRLEGRYHSGIDDSRNIARIWITMYQDGFRISEDDINILI